MLQPIGKNIRKLRKEHNLTQEELAELLNVTSQAVSKWENGTGMPDISQIIPLASVFGVSTDLLFGVSDKNEQNDVEKIIEELHTKNKNLEDHIGENLHDLGLSNDFLNMPPKVQATKEKKIKINRI